ncbi:Cytochrome P450 [Corchorus olitorius]|uniref:Cytochrome P450 n=1 Tax=Corchorus olitorius TaxID=93759 RepID=A0A1R3GAL0_9ROSI|nr:Cytochrome P450 [Corchorus olitorius]
MVGGTGVSHTTTDAMAYLKAVKETFHDQREKYDSLLKRMFQGDDHHVYKAFLDILNRHRENKFINEAHKVKKPEIFAKATEELDRVIGRDRWVEEKDIANLPCIYAIAKETMRLHPVAPIQPGHNSSKCPANVQNMGAAALAASKQPSSSQPNP